MKRITFNVIPLSLLLTTLLLFCSETTAQDTAYKLPLSYVCQKARTPLIIDGLAEEKDWEAPWTDWFIDIQGVKKPKYSTRVKMLWDDTYFYFFAELEEPHIRGDITQRDEVIFYNNDFEIFIDPDGDTFNYYELEVNVLNTVWDLFLPRPYRTGGPAIDDWDIKGLKTAVAIDGTLNDPSDIDKKWTVEIAIPWKSMEAASFKDTPKGQTWRVNFSRVNWDYELINGKYQRKKDANGNYLPEYNWVWSPQYVINMHEPERWGYVYFAEDENTAFQYGQDEQLKQLLFSYYKAQANHKRQFGSYTTNLKVLNLPEKIATDSLNIQIELHKGGYNLYATSPYTGIEWNITERGRLWKNEL